MKKVTKITSVCFVALLTIPLISSFFLNKKQAANEDIISFPSADENFHINFSKFLEQKFYFRPQIIEANKKIDNAFLKIQNDLIHEKLSGIFGNDYLEPVIVNHAIYGKEDWLFYDGDDSVGYYRGTNLPSDKELEEQADSLLKLKEACVNKGVNLVVLACPNKEQVYPEYMPSYTIKNNYKRLPRIRDYMVSKGINYVYPLQEIIDAKQYGLVYSKQDTHWNARGGYVGYKTMMSTIGRQTYEPTYLDYEKTGGDLSNMCGFQTTYVDTVSNYKETSKIDFLLSGDTIHTINENENNKIYIVSDSFRMALQPYAIKDFGETFSLHRSNMKSKESLEFLSTMSEGDTLLIQFVERYDDCVIEVSNNIINAWSK